MTPAAPWKIAVWGQFGAAIDSLEKAIDECPDDVWGDRSHPPEYWYLVFHTLFFLDFYLSETTSEAEFVPPTPFTLSEFDPAGAMPPRVYSKDEMRRYLNHGREKCRARIRGMTDEQAASPCDFERRDFSALGMLLYNMRHVQHHAAQLNLMLRQRIDSAPRWVSKARIDLGGE